MGKVVVFPHSAYVRPITVPTKSRYQIKVKVIDRNYAERTRWKVQWAIQNAAGFSALNGFTDASVFARQWHSFSVSSRLLPRFLKRDLDRMVERGLIRLRINGIEVVARATA